MEVITKKVVLELSDESVQAIAAAVAAALGGAAAGDAGKLWSADELAARYNCSKYTAQERIRSGEFGDPVRCGRHLLVTAEGIRQFEAKKAENGTRRGRPVKQRTASRGNPGPI